MVELLRIVFDNGIVVFAEDDIDKLNLNNKFIKITNYETNNTEYIDPNMIVHIKPAIDSTNKDCVEKECDRILKWIEKSDDGHYGCVPKEMNILFLYNLRKKGYNIIYDETRTEFRYDTKYIYIKVKCKCGNVVHSIIDKKENGIFEHLIGCKCGKRYTRDINGNIKEKYYE